MPGHFLPITDCRSLPASVERGGAGSAVTSKLAYSAVSSKCKPFRVTSRGIFCSTSVKAKTRKEINKMKQPLHLKTKIISKMLLSLGLGFVLVSSITQVHGDTPAIPSPPPQWGRVATIHSLGDVTRGETGVFMINVTNPISGTYVNFSVSGTAIPGVDYVPLVSPVPIIPWGSTGFAYILVETLPDRRGSFIRRAFDIVVTLEPGLGYTVGQPGSDQMIIEPLPREFPSLPRPGSTPGRRP